MGFDTPFEFHESFSSVIKPCDSVIVSCGATVAFCNLAGLLNYGDASYSMNAYFRQNNNNPMLNSHESEQKTSDRLVQTPGQGEFHSLAKNKTLAYFMLELFANSNDISASLKHVIIWMYFLIAASHVPAAIRDTYIDETFPFQPLAMFTVNVSSMNSSKRLISPSLEKHRYCDRVVPQYELVPEERLQYYIQQTPESDRPALESIPSLYDRPLPEEVHIRGFAWSQMLQYPQLNMGVPSPDEDIISLYGPIYLTGVRVKRVLALARDLGETPWFKWENETLTCKKK